MTGPSPHTQPRPANLVSGALGFADAYERYLVGPIFRPWAERLIDRSDLARNESVVDVACGTGIVSRLARRRVGRAARVVAIDKSPAMLAIARALDDTIEWREGDALVLPLSDDERHDVVFCHQGLQFFPDKPAALREMRRILQPGGRVALGVWRSREENTLFGEMDSVAERFVGPIHDVRHSLGNADVLSRLLIEGGFHDVDVTPATLETRLEIEPTILARMNAMAVISMSERGKTLADDERATMSAAIVEASLPEIARFVDDGAIGFQTSSNIAVARI